MEKEINLKMVGLYYDYLKVIKNYAVTARIMIDKIYIQFNSLIIN